MSIGIDARIGLGFDRNRSQSRLRNKCVYCWEGFKKMFLRTSSTQEILDSVETIPLNESHVVNLYLDKVFLL
jgi:diacylglycerol kinase (ATP)